jgi:N-hydroxyarylamine O-acetyltransferase
MDVGDALQHDGARAYRLTNDDRAVILHQRERDGRWEAQYRFTLRPRRLAEYAAACLYHQTSPDSSFTRRVIITRATPDGRVTLSDLRLITTHDGARQEEPVSPDEYLDVLRDRFGVTLDASPFDER